MCGAVYNETTLQKGGKSQNIIGLGWLSLFEKKNHIRKETKEQAAFPVAKTVHNLEVIIHMFIQTGIASLHEEFPPSVTHFSYMKALTGLGHRETTNNTWPSADQQKGIMVSVHHTWLQGAQKQAQITCQLENIWDWEQFVGTHDQTSIIVLNWYVILTTDFQMFPHNTRGQWEKSEKAEIFPIEFFKAPYGNTTEL